MKTVKLVTIPEHQEPQVTSVLCDLCGKEIKPSPRGEVNRVEIEHTYGTSWPECGGGSILFFDVCPECFMGKVVPALEEMGATPQTREWEY